MVTEIVAEKACQLLPAYEWRVTDQRVKATRAAKEGLQMSVADVLGGGVM